MLPPMNNLDVTPYVKKESSPTIVTDMTDDR
jgi:hypothetical protein